MEEKLPVLISVPHGGKDIPDELTDINNLSPKDIFEDGDACTREIYDFKNEVAAFLDTQIARAFVDLNRSADDQPPKNPDGVVKTVTTMEVPVYKPDAFPDDKLISQLLKKYYDPYHSRIEKLMNPGEVKIAFDCHSMLPISPLIDEQPGQKRPLVCLSNRGNRLGQPNSQRGVTTCPAYWLQKLAECFRQIFDYGKDDVKLNEPFTGGFIIQAHSHKTPWLQIEINRKMYLAEPYFDREKLTVSEERIAELRQKILTTLTLFLKQIK